MDANTAIVASATAAFFGEFPILYALTLGVFSLVALLGYRLYLDKTNKGAPVTREDFNEMKRCNKEEHKSLEARIESIDKKLDDVSISVAEIRGAINTKIKG